MVEEEICILREKLNKSIVTGQNYEIIYEISIQLDELIAKHYNNTLKQYKKRKRICSIFSFV